MTPQELKNSILQLAIQGKLVEQRPEEGTAAEFVEKIARHGTHKTTGTTRTHKTTGTTETKPRVACRVPSVPEVPDVPSVPPIPDDEKPFDIPESWEWVRLETVLLVQPSNGFSPKAVDYQTSYKNLTLTATTSGYFKTRAFKYVDITEDTAEKYYLHDNDILVQRSNSRELVGTSCIYRHGSKQFIYPDLMMRFHVMDGINVDYIDCVLKSPFCRAYFQRTASGTSESMPKINQKIVRNTLIPLPPLAEQKRIVAKLEEILPLCERLK